jgi:hypothetical protein
MARTANLSIALTGKDTTAITASGNTSNYLEMIVADIPTDALDSYILTIPAATAAITIKSTALAVAGITNVAYVIVVTYNAAEATPKVQLVVDTVATVANRHAAGMYTSSITIATTSLSNPCTVQAFFYKAY